MKKCRKYKLKTELPMECFLTHQSISTTSPKRPTHATTRTRTHIRLGILVGAGIQQQPHAVRATSLSGINQRRVSVLRAPPMCRPQCVRPPTSAAVIRLSRPPMCKQKNDRIQFNESSSQVRKIFEKIYGLVFSKIKYRLKKVWGSEKSAKSE